MTNNTIAGFIRMAREKIGAQYKITWSDGATATRALARVSSRGELISVDGCYGAELTRENCEIVGDILKVYKAPGRWDDDKNQYVADWENRQLCYTLQFID